MRDRMFGLETECGLTVFTPGGERVCPEATIQGLLRLARKRFPHLRAMGHKGIFLENGSLLYLDAGCHVECSTPECQDPWELVRYQKAGERILAGLARQYASGPGRGTQELVLSRCGWDLAYGSNSAWGCHESYLHEADPECLPEQIIPHLVTRIVYTGAGGWNSLGPEMEFLVSPRVSHLARTMSAESMQDRGIFHTKDEPLSKDAYHRLHILSGESLCSEIASWLKIGTTALVVAMTEAGLTPGRDLALRSPLTAMRAIARDPFCRTPVKRASGEPMTAIQIQRHYLTQAEQHACGPFMPPWAEAVCRTWRQTLDALEQGAPESMERVLDWAMKRAFFKDHVCRSGFTWDEILTWNPFLKSLHLAARRVRLEQEICVEDLEELLEEGSLIAGEVGEVKSAMKQKGLSWGRFMEFLKLRNELHEMDVRFGALEGEKSIFACLDRKGLLRHHVQGVNNIDDAVRNPPARGRARLRGQAVKELARDGERAMCDWHVVYDEKHGRVLELLDPFDEKANWESLPKGAERGLQARLEILQGGHGRSFIRGLERVRRLRRSSRDVPF